MTIDNHKKVLIVEDESAIREAVALLFERDGYEVLEAENGKDGLDTALEEKPDLLVLDVMMPKMSGTEMLREVRKDEDWGKDVLVVFYTNLEGGPDEKEALEYGARRFLTKIDTPLSELVHISEEVLAISSDDYDDYYEE